MTPKLYKLCWPHECEPPHGAVRGSQVDMLAEQFARFGWDPTKPKLVGYVYNDGDSTRIQLLSGSHRWEAARQAHIQMPVVLHNYEDVLAAFGNLEKWSATMRSGDLICASSL